MASLYQKGGGASSTYAGFGGSYGGMAPSTTATSYGSDPSFRSSFGTDPLSLYGSSSAYGSSASSWQQMDPLFSSLKRPGDEVFYSGDAMPKRTRYEMPQLFTPFPQRPGEKDCVFYMRTRTCSFGANCKFDHPAWVPAGGIPDWKEIHFVLVAGQHLAAWRRLDEAPCTGLVAAAKRMQQGFERAQLRSLASELIMKKLPAKGCSTCGCSTHMSSIKDALLLKTLKVAVFQKKHSDLSVAILS